MVVFTCNSCGESVKKGQVEKHVNMCRHCEYLSCMDCGKDFWGDDYKSHVKCVSEDQKYGGKGYEGKTHKGDVKQQEWMQKIHVAMEKTNINPKVRDILQQMYAFDNIPRKKGKFQNWMNNSLKIHNAILQDQVWDIFSEATKKEPSEKQEKGPVAVGNQSEKSDVASRLCEEDAANTGPSAKNKSRREQREERRKDKKEKKELRLQSQQDSLQPLKVKKAKKKKWEEEDEKVFQSSCTKVTKKKRQAIDAEANGCGLLAEKAAGPKAKKCKYIPSGEESCIEVNRINFPGSEENEGEHQGKFNWKGTIKAVLRQAPDNEISIKKLRKKVLAQFYAVAGDHHKSEEEILALFNKKVNNNPKFKVLKEKVRFVK
ncbi:cell growth-regulating nucleolar protein [Sphaerodactylus townsendi]|uniref:cell growth-regulating nucleolar protein n=1 Tax=Sphaerodactylus townsendi TaxID=933632 RepID=UPI002026C6F5|nr:cell growth-regulating nucleolar protein [Sphaerodactylus townsendi]XP_048366099.1 cell growth-regulating nucleolar protein [Sphaerodactylus townsendi]XP_048366100.1 cell growth-regulating nucleolar protein [Sphaerodactylus townsendi]